MIWHPLYTRPRTEKKVAKGLDLLGIETYCPLITRVRQWSDRRKKILVPAIPSYVFVHTEEQKRHEVFEVPGVVRFLFWDGRPAIVRDFEIEAMKNALSGNVESTEVRHYSPGDMVRIPAGPFRNYEAVLERRDDKYLFLYLEETGLQIIVKLV